MKRLVAGELFMDELMQADSIGRRRAVFLDRDGVINEDLGYVHRPEDFRLLPQVPQALRLLQENGFMLVVVTNQAGIGRGLFREEDYWRTTIYMRRLLLEQRVQLADVRYCPHHPVHGLHPWRVDCSCRKPNPGMILAAAADLRINLERSYLVGDKASDVEAGRRAGLAGCVLIQTENSLDPSASALAEAICTNLLEAAEWIITQKG